MKKSFKFDFEDISANKAIEYDRDEFLEEKLSVVIEDGIPVLYANQKAFMLLAKIFVKVALCEYPNGFHVHINQDFDADQPETFRIVLDKK